jgi:PhoH-like ATPase
MQPLYDNLSVIENRLSTDTPKGGSILELLDSEKIVVTPLSYIRGRSIVKVFFIIDEAQNLTPHEIKTIITGLERKPKWFSPVIFSRSTTPTSTASQTA